MKRNIKRKRKRAGVGYSTSLTVCRPRPLTDGASKHSAYAFSRKKLSIQLFNALMRSFAFHRRHWVHIKQTVSAIKLLLLKHLANGTHCVCSQPSKCLGPSQQTLDRHYDDGIGKYDIFNEGNVMSAIGTWKWAFLHPGTHTKSGDMGTPWRHDNGLLGGPHSVTGSF